MTVLKRAVDDNYLAQRVAWLAVVFCGAHKLIENLDLGTERRDAIPLPQRSKRTPCLSSC